MSHKHWIFGLVFSVLMIGSQAPAQQVAGGGPLDHLRFIDIRDLLKYNTDLAGTANLLMKTLENHPEKILGQTASPISFYRSGPKGPRGSETSVEGKTIFIYSKANDGSETRRNTVLGADLEDIVVEDLDRGLDQAQVFRLQMLLFVHDENRVPGDSPDDYYFRRVALKVDWTIPAEYAENRVQLLYAMDEIPLSRTNFQVLGDLLDRKVILEDTTNRITKVFPIAVGAFDVRTAYGMDNNVSLMTYEFHDAVLKKTESEQSALPNTRSRVYPSYYKGRPFLGIFDREKGYRQIGMHYQIDSQLRRGFFSHGCIRVEDLYLYQLDAIVNEGVQNEIPVKMVYDLDGYDNIEPIMPRIDSSYNVVNYSQRAPYQGGKWTTVPCRHSKYQVRYYGDIFHTVASEECLTSLVSRQGSVDEIINYMKGISSIPPVAYTSMDNHVPVERQTGGGEVEAGNYGTDNFKSLDEFLQGQGVRKFYTSEKDQISRYLRTYCRGKQLNTSRNCDNALRKQLQNSPGGLY